MVEFAQKHGIKKKIAFFRKGGKGNERMFGNKMFHLASSFGSSYMLDLVKVFFNSNTATENTRDISSLKYQNLGYRAQDNSWRFP